MNLYYLKEHLLTLRFNFYINIYFDIYFIVCYKFLEEKFIISLYTNFSRTFYLFLHVSYGDRSEMHCVSLLLLQGVTILQKIKLTVLSQLKSTF